jgi:hypothetical protein
MIDFISIHEKLEQEGFGNIIAANAFAPRATHACHEGKPRDTNDIE